MNDLSVISGATELLINQHEVPMTSKSKRLHQIGMAAMEQFSIRGYAKTSVEDIAKAAGIGKGTIYDYYRAKEEIFVAAIKTWINLQGDQINDQLVGMNDPEQKLTSTVQYLLENCNLEDPATATLSFEIVQQTMLPTGILRNKQHLLKDMFASQVRLVRGILMEGIAAGVFLPETALDADRIAVNLLAFLDGIIWHTLIMGNYIDPNQHVQYYMKLLFNEIKTTQGHQQNQRSGEE